MSKNKNSRSAGDSDSPAAGRAKAPPRVKTDAERAREQEMFDIRAIPREERGTELNARLSALMAEERRDRFCRLLPKRMQKLKVAVAHVVALSSPSSYQYEQAEADGIVALGAAIAARLKQSFAGVPTEKGLYDL